MKKSSRTKPAAAPLQASVDRPGDDLPPEVLAGPQSPTEKQKEREAAEIFSLFRRELGSGAFVTLSRCHPPSGQFKMAYVGTIPVDDFTIERISSVYGGGDFMAHARSSAGTFNEQRRFTIDHMIAPKNPQSTTAEKKPEPAEKVDLPGLVRAIHEAQPKPADNSGLVEIVKAALARPEPKGETAAILETLKEIREESRRSEDRFLKLFEAMRQNNTPEPRRSLREELEDAKELMDLIGSGGGDKEKPWYADVAVELAKNAGPLLKQFAGGAPAIPGAPLLTPAASAAVTAPPASSEPLNVTGTGDPAAANPPADMNPMLSIAIASFRNSAIKAAKAAKDPYELVATSLGFVADNFPQYLIAIRATANGADWFNQIFAQHADASKHLKFLGDVRDAVLLNAFVAHAGSFAAQNKTGAETVAAFLGWVTPEFHDALFNATDPENWALAFDGATLPESAPGTGDGAALDPAWLEELRAAVIAKLDLQETEAEPEQTPAAAVTSTSAKNGAVAGKKR